MDAAKELELTVTESHNVGPCLAAESYTYLPGYLPTGCCKRVDEPTCHCMPFARETANNTPLPVAHTRDRDFE